MLSSLSKLGQSDYNEEPRFWVYLNNSETFSFFETLDTYTIKYPQYFWCCVVNDYVYEL